MQLADCRIYRYDLPLIRPLVIQGRVTRIRSGLIVVMQDSAGNEGHGEIAPWPGLHPENLQEAQTQAHQESVRLLDGQPSSESLLASVRFGFESAWLDMQAARVGLTPWEILYPGSQPLVAINGLLTGTRQEILQDAHLKAQAGYQALKLKVGRQSVAEDIALVQAVRAAIGPALSLRLDANRAWTLSEAIACAQGIKDCAIEYLEEPVADPAWLQPLYQTTGIPLALDETLQEPDWESWLLEGIQTLILRPGLLGRRMLSRVRARYPDLRLVISGSFESGIGLTALCQLAAGFTGTPMGLDTYAWLAEDVLQERIPLHSGTIDNREAWDLSRRLCWQRLHRVPA